MKNYLEESKHIFEKYLKYMLVTTYVHIKLMANFHLHLGKKNFQN